MMDLHHHLDTVIACLQDNHFHQETGGVRATLHSVQSTILAKGIQRFFISISDIKYKGTTNLAKDIQSENSKDSLARRLLLYTVLHEADTYNGLVGICQTMGTHRHEVSEGAE